MTSSRYWVLHTESRLPRTYGFPDRSSCPRLLLRAVVAVLGVVRYALRAVQVRERVNVPAPVLLRRAGPPEVDTGVGDSAPHLGQLDGRIGLRIVALPGRGVLQVLDPVAEVCLQGLDLALVKARVPDHVPDLRGPRCLLVRRLCHESSIAENIVIRKSLRPLSRGILRCW